MKTIKQLHKAEYAPIADLVTYRVLPVRTLSYLDPFLFLNHHGPQVYPKNNGGLPFGPHPHRGMETVTFILNGDISHKDNSGHESIISAGGVQWMTAGSGLIHAEVSSDEFMASGGPLEILQVWINLPARSKMTKPFYKGLQEKDIPNIKTNDGVMINLISGKWNNESGPFHSDIGVHLSIINFDKSGSLGFHVPQGYTIFFYVISGKLNVNDTDVDVLNLAEFNDDGEEIKINALTQSILLFGHAKPLNEPVVSQGPFVMNTEEEIQQAYEDYRNGKFGAWQG